MREENFSEFSKRVRLRKKRVCKITNSWGTYDYYKYYRKNKPKDKRYVLTESQYFAIIRRVNQELGDELLKSTRIILPYKMGNLEIRKIDLTPRFGKNGIIKNRFVDWDSTLKLWYKDKEAHTDKILIYDESTEGFKFIYNKNQAVFVNKFYYQFRLNDMIRSKMFKNAKQGKFDAYLAYNSIRYD